MNDKIRFYRDRAREATEEARVAPLEKVRERALRSAAAWRGMAERATVVEQARARRLAEAKSRADMAQEAARKSVPLPG